MGIGIRDWALVFLDYSSIDKRLLFVTFGFDFWLELGIGMGDLDLGLGLGIGIGDWY